MVNPRKIDRPRRLEFNIPSSLHARLETLLHSELEQRVPYGAYSTLITQLLRDWVEAREG